jgi:hypothetical protein
MRASGLRGLRGEIEANPADVGFVDDVGRDHLQGDGAAGGDDRPGGGGGAVRVGGEGQGRAVDAVGGKQAGDGDGIEPGLAGFHGAGHDGAGGRDIGREVAR